MKRFKRFNYSKTGCMYTSLTRELRKSILELVNADIKEENELNNS